MANELDLLDRQFGELAVTIETTFGDERYGTLRPIIDDLVTLRMKVGDAARHMHDLKDALAGMLDAFGGYVTPEVDRGITAMQSIGIDRWSAQAAFADRAARHPGSPEGLGEDESLFGDQPSSGPLRSAGGASESGEAAPEIPEGFIVWSGGERPVPMGATVDVLFNDGTLIEASSAEIWDNVPHGQDYWNRNRLNIYIVAYRLVSAMLSHDRSPVSPVEGRHWIHYMSECGRAGGNGWSDEIDWTLAALYEIRPEGPPEFLVRAQYKIPESEGWVIVAPGVDIPINQSGVEYVLDNGDRTRNWLRGAPESDQRIIAYRVVAPSQPEPPANAGGVYAPEHEEEVS